jgi:four helix bundle protein
MSEQQEVMKRRTKDFAIRVVHMVDSLPRRPAAWAISKQILRSATSVAANYRAAGRSRSRREFAARIGIVMEEADETQFWLELISECGLLDQRRLTPLETEAGELAAIFSASYHTARTKQ